MSGLTYLTKTRVKIVLTHDDAKVPTYAKDGDAGADVRVVPNAKEYHREVVNRLEFQVCRDEKLNEVTYEDGDYLIQANETVMLDLGFRIQLEPGWEMQVRSRSGIAKRGLVVANAPGTIDSGYRGPCMVLLHNNTTYTRVIKPDTRVAQFVVKRAPQAQFTQVEQLDDSDRNEGGFGSTGTK